MEYLSIVDQRGRWMMETFCNASVGCVPESRVLFVGAPELSDCLICRLFMNVLKTLVLGSLHNLALESGVGFDILLTLALTWC